MPNDEFTSPFSRFVNRSARGLQDFTINTLQSLPEPVKLPVRQAVGRVLTNTIWPHGYTSQHAGIMKDEFSPNMIGDTISSIVKDKPLVPDDATRRPLFRAYFDLPTQDKEHVYNQVGKNFYINPDTKNEEAQKTINSFNVDSKLGLYGGGQTRINPISGNYMAGHPDPWNFDLSQDEIKQQQGKPLTTVNFARSALEAIGNPPRLMTTGYYNPAPKEKSYFPAANDVYRQ